MTDTRIELDEKAFSAAWHNWLVNTDGNKMDRDMALGYAIQAYLSAAPAETHYKCNICGGNPTAFPYKPDRITKVF